ncbi:MAG TPA: HypC/HybG/HupF family hydrogenase formation chaperone [Chloroflexia bacterium]|nr:HypC/HybG/HupF family hydrogenase formation chaperone [Chloroflexia bacterium]
MKDLFLDIKLPGFAARDTFRCATCADEALPGKVLRIMSEEAFAEVEMGADTALVDVSLVENVAPGEILLIHAGVALGRASKA